MNTTDGLDVENTRDVVTAATTNSTKSLVSGLVSTTFDQLPPSVVRATKRVILDTMAATIGGFRTDVADALLAVKKRQAGAAEATLLVDGTKVPVETAAHVHGQLANLLDADDTMVGKGHFASATVAAALALAEREGRTGQELIAAVACGYELTARLGCALRQSVLDENGDLGGLFGFSWLSFGAATAAAKLLGLTPQQTAEAYGQTSVFTTVPFDVIRHNQQLVELGRPAYWHRYQVPGAAAEAGVSGALFVQQGFVARDDLFDEGSGFWKSLAATGIDWQVLHHGLGGWLIEEAAFKEHPFCRFGSTALDLFSEIVETSDLQADDIDEVIVRIPPMAQQLQQAVETVYVDEPLKLFISLPTAFALVVAGVPAGPRWWEVALDDASVRRFASKVSYVIDDRFADTMKAELESDGLMRRLPTEVVVRAHGTETCRFSEYAVGDPWSPTHAMTDDQLADKVRRYSDGRLLSRQADALVEAAFALDGAESISALIAAASPAV
jgi:2-methylcitrate dehydratase PrpD